MFKEVSVPHPNSAGRPESTNHSTKVSETAGDGCLPQLRKRKLHRIAVMALATALLLPAAGCKTFRNLAVREAVMVSYRDMVWAKRAYNLRYGNCNRPYGDHFQNGFCAGYADTCNGGDGYVPAMPPMDYRGYQYQSAEGVQCVNAWFEGYPAGVAAAKKEKVGNYNDILVSKMIDSAVTQEKNQKNALPQNIPVVNSNGQQPLAAGRSQPPVASMMTRYDNSLNYGSATREAELPRYINDPQPFQQSAPASQSWQAAPEPISPVSTKRWQTAEPNATPAPRSAPASLNPPIVRPQESYSAPPPPPIMTGSGLQPQASNRLPAPKESATNEPVIQRTSFESTRRNR